MSQALVFSVAQSLHSTVLPRRLSAAEWSEQAADPRLLGHLTHAHDGGAASSGLQVLGGQGPHIDAWFSSRPATAGCSGAVRWRHDGAWLYGTLHLDGRTGSLEETAYRAYLDVFAALRETGCAQLLRVWNYLPAINRAEAGLERYRQFNVGRQRAFVEAGHDAFEGSPAACAIGKSAGAMGLHFLAGLVRPRPVENPRQVPAYHYPSQYGPRAPTFSRAAWVDLGGRAAALLVSGTASIVGHHSRHPGDVIAQTQETVANLRAVLEVASARGGERLALADMHSTVYVRHAEHFDAVREVWSDALGGAGRIACNAIYLEADICRSELLVEIEGHLLLETPHAVPPCL
jgi:chorismate lyase / 3-hydroxybenzoate synthase